MPINDIQLTNRRNYLGASDIPAILGLDPYKTRRDVLLLKTAELLPEKSTPAQERGNHLESSILTWYEAESGKPLKRYEYDEHRKRQPIEIIVPEYHLCVHPDAVVRNTGEPVEAKSSVKYEDWGEEGTDQVPDQVMIQVQTQLIATGSKVAYVPVLVSTYQRMEFRGYVVEAHPELQDIIKETAKTFWQTYVVDRQPMTEIGSESVLKRVIPSTGKCIELAALQQVTAENWQQIKKEIKKLEELEKAYKEELLSSMGDASEAVSPNGKLIRKLSHNPGGTRVIEPYDYVTLRYQKGI